MNDGMMVRQRFAPLSPCYACEMRSSYTHALIPSAFTCSTSPACLRFTAIIKDGVYFMFETRAWAEHT